jgi:uncharacterized membrane protein YdjX (TVP38/TMEM64 family)
VIDCGFKLQAIYGWALMANTRSSFAAHSGNYLRILLGSAIVFVSVFVARQYELPTCSEIQSSIGRVGPWGAALFGLLYVFATIFFVPGVFLALIDGLLFGPWLGTVIVSISSVFVAVMAFLIGKYLARNLIESFLIRKAWSKGLDDGLQKGGRFCAVCPTSSSIPL